MKKKEEKEEWKYSMSRSWMVSHNIGRNLFDTVTGHKSNEEVFPPSTISIRIVSGGNL